MKITVHTFAADDDFGTRSQAFGTDAEAVDKLLDAHDVTREDFAAWQAETGDDETGLWDFLEQRGSKKSIDTYNLDEDVIDVPLCAQPLPKTGVEQVREAIECLQRARDLLKAADNRQTLERVRLALSGAKGALRIQTSRAVRREQEFRASERAQALEADAKAFEADGDSSQAASLWSTYRHELAQHVEGKAVTK